jgi:hypothetical protein
VRTYLGRTNEIPELGALICDEWRIGISGAALKRKPLQQKQRGERGFLEKQIAMRLSRALGVPDLIAVDAHSVFAQVEHKSVA